MITEGMNVENAEACLARAEDIANRDSWYGDRQAPIAKALAEAQVYATLAVAEMLARIYDDNRERV